MYIYIYIYIYMYVYIYIYIYIHTHTHILASGCGSEASEGEPWVSARTGEAARESYPKS